MDAFLHTGKHLRSTHRHVVDGDITCVGQVCVGQKNIRHQIDNIPAGKVRPGLFIVGLRETAHQVLKNVTAVHSADLIRAKVAFG